MAAAADTRDMGKAPNGMPGLSCAVSESGEIGCVGGRDGEAHTLDVGLAQWRHNLQQQRLRPAHVGDVNVVRVFPSGRVLLTGSADATLMIWDAPSGRHAATLGKGGHTRGVLSAAIVDRGRNVLSASRDGTVCLWEVASQTVIARPFRGDAQVNAISLCSCTATASSSSPAPLDPREVGTDGKLLLVASDDRKLRAVDLRTKAETAFCATGTAPFTACAACSETLFAAGTEAGDVAAWDSRASAEHPLVGPFHRSAASVTDMHLGPAPHLVWASTADGQLWLQDFAARGAPAAAVVAALRQTTASSDFEPIMAFGVCNAGKVVLFVHRDGLVRLFRSQLA